MTTVLHVTRAFSAEPTLSECLVDVRVVEVPLPEALAPGGLRPDVVWISSALPPDVEALRRRFPRARILATPARTATSPDVVQLIGSADLVLPDEGVLLAAAGVHALCRRTLAS